MIRRPSASARASASHGVAPTPRERIEDALRLGSQGRELQKCANDAKRTGPR